MFGIDRLLGGDKSPGFKPGDPDALAAARKAPRPTRDQKTSLAAKEGGDISLAKIGETLEIGNGKKVDYYYTSTPNEHGFFVTFREVTDKDGNTEMKDFAGRRLRKAAKALCEKRYQAASRSEEERRARSSYRAYRRT